MKNREEEIYKQASESEDSLEPKRRYCGWEF